MLVVLVFVLRVCCLLIGCYSFPAIDSNENECTKEREIFEYQEEEDQGQANQGKPSIDAYLNPIIVLCIAYSCSLIDALSSLLLLIPR
jgi:hypothetical protein